jgi:hypothetical protein
MRARIAEITGLQIGQISVKATTTEGMVFTGRQEGLMAQAVVLVDTPACSAQGNQSHRAFRFAYMDPARLV